MITIQITVIVLFARELANKTSRRTVIYLQAPKKEILSFGFFQNISAPNHGSTALAYFLLCNQYHIIIEPCPCNSLNAAVTVSASQMEITNQHVHVINSTKYIEIHI